MIANTTRWNDWIFHLQLVRVGSVSVTITKQNFIYADKSCCAEFRTAWSWLGHPIQMTASALPFVSTKTKKKKSANFWRISIAHAIVSIRENNTFSNWTDSASTDAGQNENSNTNMLITFTIGRFESQAFSSIFRWARSRWKNKKIEFNANVHWTFSNYTCSAGKTRSVHVNGIVWLFSDSTHT